MAHVCSLVLWPDPAPGLCPSQLDRKLCFAGAVVESRVWRAFAIFSAAMAFAVPAISLRLSRSSLWLLDAMQPSAYGIFLLHYMFIIWLQYFVYDPAWPAGVKAAIVFAGALGGSWLLTVLLRKFRWWRGRFDFRAPVASWRTMLHCMANACMKNPSSCAGALHVSIFRIDVVRVCSLGLRASAGFGGLSRPRHQDRGAVRAGRRHRRRGADAGAGDGKRARRVRHHREQAGGGHHLGTQMVAASAPDGYTLLMGTFANAVNPSLNAKLPYNAHEDFAAVALLARSFSIVVVNPASPIKSIADLIAAAKAAPTRLTYGTYGTGTSAHLAGELFKHMAGVNLTTAPTRRSAAITDLIGGQIDVIFTTVASAASLVEAGQLRAIAVTSAERSPAFPQLPTVAEAGVPGYAAEAWYGLYAPAKTPPEIIDRLNNSAAKAVQSEAFKKLGKNEGLVVVAEPPQRLTAILPARKSAGAR